MDTETKTDRRILRTKEAINKAFLELFSEKELEQITINDISERANVNRGTIYLHYTDKYDLLNKCIDDHLSKMFISCSVIDINHEKVNLTGTLKAVFTYFEQHFLFFSSMLSNKRTSLFRERMLQFIVANKKEKIDEQGINQDIDKELIIQFMSSAFVGIVEWWILKNMPHSPQSMAEQVWRLFERNDI
ncbi:TetR/AcrR family transcriptional regulator [Paenibacillus psychroresistens]|uniref:TetR/AcrR family transcriptional regulator n=1 Tax=Paenibacillus psychroresistens TaxID=1778678 RepID=A0A6B8RNF5_9BACL|nr:TetR/AcrR family transcriptional regulator C-terminal domain-containing protein [Paenibacillus psychroresistens]QGQ97304.1 TetR/AcrR family transcriptional regulator [Paenibacillus psychroresistens]